jgi:uncharacterized protein YbaP (TraB family)
MRKRSKNSLLWRVVPREGGAVSYLFGTMHVRDRRAFVWLEQAYRRIDECEVFAAEFDYSHADPAVIQAALTLPEGCSLQDLLSRRAWKNLTFYCRKKLSVPPETFQSAHPILVQTALSSAFSREEMEYSLDETLWRYAQRQGKQLTGMETLEEQVELLLHIRLEQHLKSLTHLLTHYAQHRRRMKKMMRWYQQGDLRQLYQAARRDARGMRRSLLLARNERMARRFVELARQKSLFCAVGAAHLSGGKGMLRLLKQAGFSVKPVMCHAP